MKCPACQKDFDIEAAGFCPYCGTSIQSSRAQKACEVVEDHFKGNGFECPHDDSEPNPNFSICFVKQDETFYATFTFFDDYSVACTLDTQVDVPDDENSRMRAVALCGALNSALSFGRYLVSDDGRILLVLYSPLVEAYECAACETYVSTVATRFLNDRARIFDAIDSSQEALYESENYLLEVALDHSFPEFVEYDLSRDANSRNYKLYISLPGEPQVLVYAYTENASPLSFLSFTFIDIDIPTNKTAAVISLCHEWNTRSPFLRILFRSTEEGLRVVVSNFWPYAPGVSYGWLLYAALAIANKSTHLSKRLLEIVNG